MLAFEHAPEIDLRAHFALLTTYSTPMREQLGVGVEFVDKSPNRQPLPYLEPLCKVLGV
jgi:hypothetical protein